MVSLPPDSILITLMKSTPKLNFDMLRWRGLKSPRHVPFLVLKEKAIIVRKKNCVECLVLVLALLGLYGAGLGR